MFFYQTILLFTYFSIFSCEEGWTGKWFPGNSTVAPKEVQSDIGKSVTSSTDWSGKWFPREPSKITNSSDNAGYDRIMGIPSSDCDDGETNLSIDFDPNSYDHALNYLCLEKTYKPSYDEEPIQTFYDVPAFYTPVHKCMNETIIYEQKIPTLGYHRPLWAAYGEYVYLPPQRFLHNIEHGAIVALYHPCANKHLIDRLKRLVKGCLYKHVITPYRKLTPERPFALVAWGTSLELSVIDDSTLTDFIKQHALKAPEKTSRNGRYKEMLTEPSKIVTHVDDFELCPNAKQDMK